MQMNTTIKQNKRGGWSICFKGHYLGNYPTAADAARIARLNGLPLTYNERSAPALTPARPSSNTTTATTAAAVYTTK